ncbi:MAG TPA: hypothetical protein VMC08_06935 [Bacteroidales bacterium]|nr:hypothetical protein [Bacteroidales bacterium]
MKKILGLMAGILLTFPVFAQQPDTLKHGAGKGYEMNTVFGNHKEHRHVPLGYFVELNAGYTRFDSKDVFLPGIQAGIILDHHWTLGAAGSFVGNSGNLYFKDIYYNENDAQWHGAHLSGGYGGFLFEYTLLPRSVVHISFPLLIGGGYMYFQDHPPHPDSLFNPHEYPDHHSHVISGDHFFVIEPGVKVEFNIVKHLRLGLGISYRYTPDLDLSGVSADLINQFTGRLTLRFGKF